jgi:hypothetical protein
MTIIPKRGKLEGVKFHYLTVIKEAGRTSNGTIIYECLCKCGIITKVNSNSLRQGVTKSCGCWMIDNARKMFSTHGMSKTRIYKIWLGMIERCTKSNNKNYKKYGGKGIVVCSEWLLFEAFLRDMKEGYGDSLTLERINNNGNYEKSNCKWATYKEQADNRKTTIFLTVDGETKKLMEWAKISGINPNIIRQRVKTYKWSHKDAIYGRN